VTHQTIDILNTSKAKGLKHTDVFLDVFEFCFHNWTIYVRSIYLFSFNRPGGSIGRASLYYIRWQGRMWDRDLPGAIFFLILWIYFKLFKRDCFFFLALNGPGTRAMVIWSLVPLSVMISWQGFEAFCSTTFPKGQSRCSKSSFLYPTTSLISLNKLNLIHGFKYWIAHLFSFIWCTRYSPRTPQRLVGQHRHHSTALKHYKKYQHPSVDINDWRLQ